MPKPDCTVLVVKGSTQAEDYAGWLAADQARSYRVLTADCSANAIPKLTLPAGLKVDGVLLTLSTSHRDSAALIGQLKAQLASACPPIIVIGDRDMTAAVTALKAGAADYLGQDQLTATQLTTALSAAIALPPPAAIRAAHPQHQPQAALNNRQDLVEAIPQIIWTADAQGQVNYWNRRWFDYTGRQPTESMGWDALQQVHP
ncbi:MAG: PAS domain-containing protein, partial [Cyanobacteria bacterium P01_A01_bin.70]